MKGIVTPVGALVRGAAAGAIGAAAIGMFFKATGRFAPSPPEDFQPPEREQESEEPTHTVARRWVEHFMARGPIKKETKETLGNAVHFGFGSGWGAAYGLVRESLPGLGPIAGILGLGTTVWGLAENVILPAFRLAPGPKRIPLKFNGYMLAAHLAYAAAVWSAYEAFRPQSIAQVLSSVWAFRTERKMGKRLPKAARPVLRRVLKTAALAREAMI
jgi:hypothetical protein